MYKHSQRIKVKATDADTEMAKSNTQQRISGCSLLHKNIMQKITVIFIQKKKTQINSIHRFDSDSVCIIRCMKTEIVQMRATLVEMFGVLLSGAESLKFSVSTNLFETHFG